MAVKIVSEINHVVVSARRGGGGVEKWQNISASLPAAVASAHSSV